MSVDRFSDHVNSFIASTANDPFYKTFQIDHHVLPPKTESISAIVEIENDQFIFHSPECCKLIFKPIRDPPEIRWKHTLNWINTRNLFFDHVMKSVITFQRKFFETRDLKAITPITLTEFVRKFPFLHLEISRLSRLLKSNRIIFDGTKYVLRDLFLRKSRRNALILEDLISRQSSALTDRELQKIFKLEHKIDLSIRTICRYRRSLNIPASNKIKSNNPYENCFSIAIPLDKKFVKTLPKKFGVYEISIKKNVKYPNANSNVIYFGRSKNLAKRIGSYLYTEIKNSILICYKDHQQLLIRYFVTPKYVRIESELLGNFRDKFGSLPIANRQFPSGNN